MKLYNLFLFLTIILNGCYNREPMLKTGLEGRELPDFTLLLTDSSTYLNTKDIPFGQPVVLFYFGPNCPYSRAQMEEILKNVSKLQSFRFYVITPWPFSEMKRFYDKYQLNKYSNIVTGYDVNNFIRTYFKIEKIPYTAIYEENKKLKGAFLGMVSSKTIKEIAEN